MTAAAPAAPFWVLSEFKIGSKPGDGQDVPAKAIQGTTVLKSVAGASPVKGGIIVELFQNTIPDASGSVTLSLAAQDLNGNSQTAVETAIRSAGIGVSVSGVLSCVVKESQTAGADETYALIKSFEIPAAAGWTLNRDAGAIANPAAGGMDLSFTAASDGKGTGRSPDGKGSFVAIPWTQGHGYADGLAGMNF